MQKVKRSYTLLEEKLHAAAHGVGGIVGGVGAFALIYKTFGEGFLSTVGSAVYGISLFLVYLSSCIYHATPSDHPAKGTLEKIDHTSIYLIMIGTYLPACLSLFESVGAYYVFIAVWVFSVLGIIFTWVGFERYKRLGFFLYLLAGAMTVPLLFIKKVETGASVLLMLGVLAYLIGVFFYRLNKIKYMHLVWHLCVIVGSIFHYVMIYLYCY